MLLVGAVVAMIPFVPWGNFLSATLESNSVQTKPQPVVIDNNPVYGGAAGATVKVTDLASFPPNSHWVITFPSSGNSTIDFQNPDTFVKFELIRLPAELGGSKEDATAFVAFSKICVHLGCSPNYGGSTAQNPPAARQNYECPCHGSIYEVADGLAVQGPASSQPAPTNAIPMLTLTADPDGTLVIQKPIWDVNHNGVLAYGRYIDTYEDYLLPIAEGKLQPPAFPTTTTSSSSSSG